MLESNLSADLIVIVAIAVFIIFKYKQVLGHKTGHDTQQDATPTLKAPASKVVTLKQFQESVAQEAVAQPDALFEALKEEELKSVFAQMKQCEEGFTLDAFTQGAKAAFEMVMEAFNQDDRQSLKWLLSDELFREFEEELKQQEKRNQRSITTLVSILSVHPVAATLVKQQASIRVCIRSEQIQVVKNESGEIIEGDVSQIDTIEDEWVFERQLGARNPNWTITDM